MKKLFSSLTVLLLISLFFSFITPTQVKAAQAVCLEKKVIYAAAGPGTTRLENCLEPGDSISWEFKVKNGDGSVYPGKLMVRTTNVVGGLVGMNREFVPSITGEISGSDTIISGENATEYLGKPIIYKVYEDADISKEISSCQLTTAAIIQTTCQKPTCPANSENLSSALNCANNCKVACTGDHSVCCPTNQVKLPGDGTPGINPAGQPVDAGTLDALNPLKTEGSAYADDFSKPGGIVSRFLGNFAFPIAGLILFVMIVWGGFEMLAGAPTKKSIDAGKQRVTAALVGFMLLFASYWIAKILEMMFGISIL